MDDRRLVTRSNTLISSVRDEKTSGVTSIIPSVFFVFWLTSFLDSKYFFSSDISIRIKPNQPSYLSLYFVTVNSNSCFRTLPWSVLFYAPCLKVSSLTFQSHIPLINHFLSYRISSLHSPSVSGLLCSSTFIKLKITVTFYFGDFQKSSHTP